MEKDSNTDPKIEINLDAEIGEGLYSNLAIISHSSSDFIVDFVNIMPGLPKANVKARIILTPQHAKRLVGALMDNIKKYEASYGPIKEPGTDTLPVFTSPRTEA